MKLREPSPVEIIRATLVVTQVEAMIIELMNEWVIKRGGQMLVEPSETVSPILSGIMAATCRFAWRSADETDTVEIIAQKFDTMVRAYLADNAKDAFPGEAFSSISKTRQ